MIRHNQEVVAPRHSSRRIAALIYEMTEQAPLETAPPFNALSRRLRRSR